MNNWLAKKRLHGVESIRDELEAFDVSALAPVFAFVRAALLNNQDEAIGYMNRLLDNHEIGYRSVRDWPVLTELREVPDVEKRIRQMEASERRRIARARRNSHGAGTPGRKRKLTKLRGTTGSEPDVAE
jgi:hypothetical protein